MNNKVVNLSYMHLGIKQWLNPKFIWAMLAWNKNNEWKMEKSQKDSVSIFPVSLISYKLLYEGQHTEQNA